MQIINAKNLGNDIHRAVDYIHGKWGSESNYAYFEDAIVHSNEESGGLPRFYLLMDGEEILGCCGLITNDFISRHDLYPWLSSLFVEEKVRGRGWAGQLMDHAVTQACQIGFERVYLTTNHDGFYERYGWNRIEDGIDLFSSTPTRIYAKGCIDA